MKKLLFLAFMEIEEAFNTFTWYKCFEVLKNVSFSTRIGKQYMNCVEFKVWN